MDISIIIPVYNEELNIAPLISKIKADITDFSYEVVFVDDGSSDRTVEEIKKINEGNIKLVQLSRNFGQTSAMSAGIEAADGKYLAFLDGDLQNDPSDIPMMLEKLKREGLDMVAGRRVKRQDGLFLRKIPSRIANRLIYGISKIQVQDYGCTLKIMKTSIAKDLDLYGELHRFIPILADLKGAKIAEIDVKHHQRKFGQSKYGISRTLKVASDLMLMAFFLRYRQKPMHLFGTLGLGSLAIGTLIESYLFFIKLFGGSIGTRPLFYVGILLIIAGIQFITTGFLAELLMRTYYSTGNNKPYRVAETEKVSGYKRGPKSSRKKDDVIVDESVVEIDSSDGKSGF
ncbi:MAG TPA: glycosyltransferase [Alphaproteobacteria bacterium]|nr:glycosyltransferase [Alphaproteobacteria bacterium]